MKTFACVVRAASLLAFAAALAGCAAFDRGAQVRDGPGLDFSASELAAYRANQDQVLEQLYAMAGVTKDSVGAGGWDAVIDAGMDYADSRCEAYLHALFRLNRDRKTLSSQIGLVGTATAGILAAVESAARDVAITAIAFGLASSTVDNLSSNLLYDLDPSSVRTMVKTLQARYRQAKPTGYQSRAAALNVIRGYAMLCVPASIEAEVNLAVKSSAPVAAEGDGRTGKPPVVSNAESVVAEFTVRTDDNTTVLRDFVFPGGKMNDANRAALEKFLQERKIAVDVSSFMRLGRFAAEREEAVRALKLK